MRLRELAWRIAPHALLAGLALAVTWPLFRAAGLPYNVDISGYFPLTPDAYAARFWPLWNEHGGMATLQFLPAMLLEAPLIALGQLAHWDMAIHVKVRILLGLAVAGMGMYALVARYLRDRLSSLPRWAALLVPLAPAVFYMLNPWSIHRVFQYFLWMGYVLAPLVVLAFERFAAAPSLRSALVFSLVCAVATTDPHNPATFAILLLPLAGVRLARAIRRANAARFVRFGLVAAGAYAAFAAFWLFPTLYNALYNPAFGPPYVMSDQMLSVLSRHATLWDVVRLMHNYEPRAALAPSGGLLGAWLVAGFLIPLLAANALVLRWRSATVWAFGALGVAATLLGFGATQPIGPFYRWLLFRAPWGEGLSWLFRDPYRWGGIQAFAYSVLAGFAILELVLLAGRVRWPRLRMVARASTPVVAIACAALFVTPAVAGYMGSVYSPIVIPKEYAEANAYLAASAPDANVIWMPRMLGATTWSAGRTLEYFDATSSARAAFGPFRAGTTNYFDFLDDATRDGAPVGPLLARIGVDEVMFHNDRAPMAGATTLRQLEDVGFVQTARFGDSRTNAIDQSTLSMTYTPASRFAIFGPRLAQQAFSASEANATSLVVTATRVGHPPPLTLTIRDASNRSIGAWSASGADGASTMTFDLSGFTLSPGAPYAFELGVRGAGGDTDDRYDLSYYTVDTYDGGSARSTIDGENWTALRGDVAFELHVALEGFLSALKSPDAAPLFRSSASMIASPDGLTILRDLATLPANSSVAHDGVVFTNAGASAREEFATTNASWQWVTDFGASQLDALAPFLPAHAFTAPFAATTNADGKLGWARGTEGFAYYGWGWDLSLAALKLEDWGFDGGKGIAFTSAPANLTVEPPAGGARSGVVLARVFESPKGGSLAVHDASGVIGVVDTRADVAGFRWVEVGNTTDASRLVVENRGGFQGVNLLAVVSTSELAAASSARDARFALTPTTVIGEAEVLPGLSDRIVAIPGVGRFASLADNVSVPFAIASGGDASLWLRVADAGRVPRALIDGVDAGAAVCVAACDGPAPWVMLDAGALAVGDHVLTLDGSGDAPFLVDSLALTTASLGANAAPAALAWTRESATSYRVQLDARAPSLVVFAQPFDAGWVAQDDQGRAIQSVVVDGVVNGFLVAPGTTSLHVEYAPQHWADLGALVTAAALVALLVILAPLGRRASPRPAIPSESIPQESV